VRNAAFSCDECSAALDDCEWLIDGKCQKKKCLVTNRTKKVKDNGWSSDGSIVLAEVLSFFFFQPYSLSIRMKRFLLLLLICYGVLYWYVHSKPKRLSLLGAFAKLRKATVSFVMSVCPSVLPPVCMPVRMEQLDSQWTDFHENLCSSAFWKSLEKIQVWLKFGKNNGYFTSRLMYIYDSISLNYS